MESKAGSKGPLCYRPSDLVFLWPSPSVFSKLCLASDNPVLSCLDLGWVIFHFLVQSTATLSKHHESSTRSNGHLVRQETAARQAWTEQAPALASAACSLSCILSPSTIGPHIGWHWAASSKFSLSCLSRLRWSWYLPVPEGQKQVSSFKTQAVRMTGSSRAIKWAWASSCSLAVTNRSHLCHPRSPKVKPINQSINQLGLGRWLS